MKNITKAFLLAMTLLAGTAEAVTDTFTASGTWTAPAGVTSVSVEAWGGGGAGGGNTTTSDGGGGGGGGAYSSTANIAVIPGNVYTVTVGAGGVAVLGGTGGAGGDSWFSTAGTILARGGAGGNPPAGGNGGIGGLGGAAAAGIGATKFSGGDGGTGRNNGTGRGGPGGSSAGTAANGTSGTDPYSTLVAAAPPAGGGIGGNGGNSGADGLAPASGNGGGGGGSGDRTLANRTGGAGAGGKVIITYIIPSVTAISLADPSPTGAASVSWLVTFNTGVTGVSSSNFALVNTGLGGTPAITGVSGSGTAWTVTASTGTGSGTLGLDMANATGVSPAPGNLPFTGDVYTLDRTGPAVSSIARVDPTPTALTSVSWTVTFNESVTGVDAADFALAQSGGVSGALITAVTPVSGTTYTVTADTGAGNGVLGLNLADDDSIVDAAGNPLGGAGAANGDFIGETYSVAKSASVTASPSIDCTNVTDIGSQPWGTLNGPRASDDVYATASVNDNQTTNYLQCTRYGFAIPDGATINGITVDIERNASNTLVRDFAVRLVKDVSGVPTIQATDRSTATNYTTTDVVEAHGGAADLWGDVWTAADINAPNFGAALAARKNGTSGGARTVRVDHMPITVIYTVPMPLAEYRMDEGGWNGTADEAADSSGNGLHGTAQSGATTAAAKICNGANLAANYVEAADNALLDIPSTLTVTAWINPARWGGAAGKDALMTILSKDTNYEAHITSTGAINWWWGTGSITSAATAPIGAWTHVALVYASGSQTIYINGVASGTAAVAGALPVNANPLQIGNDQEFGGGTRRFDGMIDEVKIFNGALTAAQISTGYANENAGRNWDGTTRTCPVSAPDHLEIHSVGTGVTCTPSTLTVVACADAVCNSYTSGVSGTLSATGTPTVNWDGTTGGALGAGFDIPSGGGSVDKDVQVTTPGTVTFGVASVSPVPANPATCNFGDNAPDNNNCVFTASDAGFLVSAPDHVAETASTLTVRAVKKADNSLACVPAFQSVSKTVNLKCAYVNPGTGTLPARVGGAALNAGNDGAAACDGAGGNISLGFDATGVATPALRYADVGEMRIDASFSGAAGTVDEGLVMTGSGTFIAAPASFAFSGITAGSIKAGTAFVATVTARNNIGATTPNFGNESSAEGVTLTSSLVTPDPVAFPAASNPAPGNNVIAGTEFGAGGMVNDADGVATVNNLSWGEVGSITLTANLTSGSTNNCSTLPDHDGYLCSGLSATGTSATVGAFIPDHLDTEVVATATTPMPCPAGLTCPATYDGFVYSGQPFSVRVTARNLAGGTTLNYDDGFGLSKAVTLSAWDALGSTTTQNPGPGALANGAVAAAAFAAGVGVTATPTYTFSATPTAPTDIFMRATDTDGVTSLRATPASSVEGGVMVASGRIRIGNAHGSELLPLPMIATVQYYNAANWVNSATDSVTSLTLGVSNYQCKSACPWTTTLTPVPGTLSAGVLNFSLSRPTGGGTGSVDVSASAPDYLLTGSNGAAVNPSNTARATFGVYKGNNEFIYMREVY